MAKQKQETVMQQIEEMVIQEIEVTTENYLDNHLQGLKNCLSQKMREMGVPQTQLNILLDKFKNGPYTYFTDGAQLEVSLEALVRDYLTHKIKSVL